MFGVLQGIILFIAVGRSKKGNVSANRLLSYFILIITLTLFGRYFYTLQPLTLLNAKILFLGDFIIFLLGPLLYFYLLKLFNVQSEFRIHTSVHVVPAFLYLVIIFPFLIADRQTYINLSGDYANVFTGIEIFAILQNLFYVMLCNRVLNKHVSESNGYNSIAPQIRFYRLLLLITVTGLIFWSVSIGFRIFDPSGSGDYLGYQLVWISLSCSIITLGYYTLSNPEILTFVSASKKYESKPTGIENIDEVSVKLDNIMRETKPYLNPKLTLTELSEISGINTHLLSRIINEKHNKNFFAYVNSFRIEEFKQILEKEESKNLTLLAIAFEAGFNSKTTFNTAFKKLTNQTPSEYFKLAGNEE
ncbi:MAG: AraC family transcriptional regulator [Ignavibacteriales bacterium]|nr:MAG: AraC family transcriptional regulator [Ignavibacteriales bacterium]